LGGLTPVNHALAVKLASVPDDIKGYGHVRTPSREGEAQASRASQSMAQSAGNEDRRGVSPTRAKTGREYRPVSR